MAQQFNQTKAGPYEIAVRPFFSLGDLFFCVQDHNIADHAFEFCEFEIVEIVGARYLLKAIYALL
jgi:hypothetical protein